MRNRRQFRANCKLTPKALQNQLRFDRRASTLMAGGHVYGCPDFIRHRLGLTSGWIDRTNLHVHHSRAITDNGEMLWLVQDAWGTNRPMIAANPDTAFEQATARRRLKRRIANRWPKVARLRRRILMGQAHVTLQNADLALASFTNRSLAFALFAATLRRFSVPPFT